MRKVKNNINACWLFIIVSTFVIVFMNSLFFHEIRIFVVNIPMFRILKGSSQMFSNIAIGILGSSIIAEAAYLIEYMAEKKVLIGKINSLYWFVYDFVLPNLGDISPEELKKFFDLGGVFYNLKNICLEYEKIIIIGNIGEKDIKKLSILEIAQMYCTNLLHIIQMQKLKSDLCLSEVNRNKEIDIFMKEMKYWKNESEKFKINTGLEYSDYLTSILDEHNKKKGESQCEIEKLTQDFFNDVDKETIIRKLMDELKNAARKEVGEFDIDRPNPFRSFIS